MADHRPLPDKRRRPMMGCRADFIDMVFGYIDRRLRSLRAKALVIAAMLLLTQLSDACPSALAQADRPQSASARWMAVTVSRSTWGAARASTVTQAIVQAIADCKSKTAGPSDCGAELKTIRTGWIVGLRCGGYRVLVSGSTLQEADEAAAHRLLQLKYISNVSLPRCVRLLELGPADEVAVSESKRQTVGGMLRE
jgi:hypothetical protein